MDFLDHPGSEGFDQSIATNECQPDITQSLALNYISQGIDPLQAVLDAQIQAPLIKPFL